jgi:hypothetical protein
MRIPHSGPEPAGVGYPIDIEMKFENRGETPLRLFRGRSHG